MSERMRVSFESVSTIDPQERTNMFRLRKKVFCDELGWDIPHCSGKEADVFDIYNSFYMNLVCKNSGGIAGSVRLIPLSDENLICTIFKRCLEGTEDVSSSNLVWEGTRLCIDESICSSRDYHSTMLQLLLALYQTCKVVGIERLMCNCSSSMLRFYRNFGLEIEKFGNMKELRHGVVHCIAFDISPLNKQALQKHASREGLNWPEIEGRGIKPACLITGKRPSYQRNIEIPENSVATV